MRCPAEIDHNPPNLQSQPNRTDQAFISALDSNDFDEKKFFSQITLKSLPFVVKIAKYSAPFAKLCEKNEYNSLWKELYSTIGLTLTKNKSHTQAFYTHDENEVCHFNLLRGSYYFHLAQQALETKEKAFSSLELYWLNQAMKFESIHAIQRYIQCLYQKLTKVSQDEVEKILIESINLSKVTLNKYGSYAYMMLAEAFFRYAAWAQQADNVNRAKSAIHSSINACIKAQNHLITSTFSIHNASLGEGLKASNSLGLECPRKAILFLRNWAVNRLQEKDLQVTA